VKSSTSLHNCKREDSSTRKVDILQILMMVDEECLGQSELQRLLWKICLQCRVIYEDVILYFLQTWAE
jgi:hypothetical protein